jgi:hypothetical protein
LGLSHHSRVWVESDHLFEEVGEQQGDSAWTTTDVEEAPASIQIEVLGEGIGQSRRGLRPCR